jgi:hypothetical protein
MPEKLHIVNILFIFWQTNATEKSLRFGGRRRQPDLWKSGGDKATLIDKMATNVRLFILFSEFCPANAGKMRLACPFYPHESMTVTQ